MLLAYSKITHVLENKSNYLKIVLKNSFHLFLRIKICLKNLKTKTIFLIKLL